MNKELEKKLRNRVKSLVENILKEEYYRDVDEDRKNILNKVLQQLDSIMDEIKIGPPYSVISSKRSKCFGYTLSRTLEGN